LALALGISAPGRKRYPKPIISTWGEMIETGTSAKYFAEILKKVGYGFHLYHLHYVIRFLVDPA
jgi:hypothetical protein